MFYFYLVLKLLFISPLDSSVCLHPDFMCDGLGQCPKQDDEISCNFTCPKNCDCFGRSFYCHQVFEVSTVQPTDIRFLDASGSGVLINQIYPIMDMIIFLNLSHCALPFLNFLSRFVSFVRGVALVLITVTPEVDGSPSIILP